MTQKYEVRYDEKVGALRIQTFDTLTKDDVHDIMSAVERELVGKDEKRYVLVDLSQGSSDMVDKEARQAFKKASDPSNFTKVALFGANPAVRMLAKVVLVVSGVSKKTRFFKSEAEALAWLREG